MKQIAAYLFKAPSTMQSAKRDTAMTAILLTSDELELTSQCLKSIDQGTACIDESFVFNLYSDGDRKARLVLAGSVAVSRMRPRAFRRVFDEVYARSDLTIQERQELVWNLECFLVLNPRQLAVYEPTILELLRSPSPKLRHRALSMAGRLNRLDTAALTALARHLHSRDPDLRLNALDGFFQLTERFGQIAPNIRDFILSDTFRARVARMQRSDPDDSVRHNAWAVLKRLRHRGKAR